MEHKSKNVVLIQETPGVQVCSHTVYSYYTLFIPHCMVCKFVQSKYGVNGRVSSAADQLQGEIQGRLVRLSGTPMLMCVMVIDHYSMNGN